MNNSIHNQTFLSSSTGANPPFVWESSPAKRGTLQIFSLCASTTVICIWSAVHRDIPPRRLTGLRSYASQAIWVFAALLIPEFVFVHALRQFLDARRLVEIFNKHSDTNRKAHWFSFWRRANKEKNVSSEDEENLIDHTIKTSEATPFTLVHAFYAVAGGYAFDIDTPTDESSDEKRIRAIIEPAGIRFLMDHDPDLTPDFSESSIKSRSNSNGLNKALLVFQLLWFCTSCISRLASRLPLTLLEVVTAAHGLCTLATYGAWWHKPLNVEESTLIIGERAREAYTFLKMVHDENINPLKEAARPASSADSIAGSQTELALALRAANRYAISDVELENLRKNALVVSAPTKTKSMIENMWILFGGLVRAAIFSGSKNFFIADISVLTSLTSVYGLVHLFGWNAQFPTTVERILWRIATVAICSCGACFSVFGVIVIVLDDVEGPYKVLEILWETVSIFLGIFALIVPFFYLLCTLYLLVESIRQLFYLPPDAFVVASWSNYLPHFS